MHVNGVSVASHFFDDLGADSMVMAQFCARVRKRADLPSVSMKDIYQYPTIKSLAASLTKPALTPSESALVEVLSGVMQVNGVTVESHFFDDLGADSMVMAQFCARVRKRADLPSVSMKDIYQHPTIKSLAAALAEPAPPYPRIASRGNCPRTQSPRSWQTESPDLSNDGGGATGQHRAVRRLRDVAVPDLPRILVALRGHRDPRLSSGSRPAPAFSTSTCGRSCSAVGSSSACASCRSSPSGFSSVAGSVSRSASGAWATSASGLSRR